MSGIQTPASGHFLDAIDPHTSWFKATCNSLRASRWTVLAARIFGRRVEGEDMGCFVAGYRWRGNLYLTEFERPADPVVHSSPETTKP
jgi:hypothetical protein